MHGGNKNRSESKAKGSDHEMNLATEELTLTQNSVKVLEKRYLKRDELGKVIETPKDLFTRVALNIAQADAMYSKKADIKGRAREFYDLMTTMDFLPNSPTLMNAGRELQQLSACFVLPIDDSMESIFETLKHTAMIHKSGGGTGFSFSRLRPRDDIVKSTKGISSGPISFMSVFDQATEAIKQGGTRRGANMGILRVDHPNIEDFITCKRDTTKLTNFNISVAITDRFMHALMMNEDYNIINPRRKEVVDRKSARKVFDMIVHEAWSTGEPGVIYIDAINKQNPTPHIGEIESTNPCGEQPLLPYESCNLGSINLAKLVIQGDSGPEIDYQNLRRIVRSSVRFLDNVIDMNKYPLDDIGKMTRGNRKIGLGVMGFADMLIQLNIAYNSEQALEIAEEVMCFIQTEARNISAELADERGAFPNFQGSVFDKKGGRKMRNATVTTVAPTGTISIIAGCSSGIEPIFALVFMRNVMEGTKMIEVNKHFEDVAHKEGFYSKELMERIAKKGTIHDMIEIPEHVRKVFVTAHDITPEWHIKMEAAFQKGTDNAVSKTINFPNTATEKEVEEAYLLAFKLGCKGVTVYRDGCRENQPMSVGEKKAASAQPNADGVIIAGPGVKVKPRPRPHQMKGATMRMMTGCGKLYVTINEDDQGLFEVFSQMGKSGGCAMSQSEAISRLISLSLRSGVDIEAILKQIKGIRCPSPFLTKGGMVLSCPDAIAKALELYLEGKREKPPVAEEAVTLKHFEEKEPTALENVVGVCPDCGNAVGYEEGCMLCRFCGWSKCG